MKRDVSKKGDVTLFIDPSETSEPISIRKTAGKPEAWLLKVGNQYVTLTKEGVQDFAKVLVTSLCFLLVII